MDQNRHRAPGPSSARQPGTNRAGFSSSRPTGGQGVRRTFSGGNDNRQFDHEVLDVARVVRVVKGGRRFSFRATVVVGDRAGRVGLGLGKSKDVQAAINKGYEQGVKRLVKFQIKNGTIKHEVSTTFKGARIFLKPAKPGTGIIAGGTVRLIADLAGLHDLVSKRWGSSNKINSARATLIALQQIRP